jgi:hypothetical protein
MDMITAICITYGRVKFLEHAIGDFINQENPGPCELLILNTFNKQTLRTDFTSVRIENLPYRPETLGHARNMAVAMAAGDKIICFDDDDVYLPHFFRTFQDNWEDGLEWVWLDKRLCAHGDVIKEISVGCHGGCFGFTKKAWAEVGGYPVTLSVGEDRVLVNKITKLVGKRVNLKDTTPPFICCWGNDAYHLSGQGDDVPGTPTAYERSKAALSRRTANGEEKMGKITLIPNYSGDWMNKAQAFMAKGIKKKLHE